MAYPPYVKIRKYARDELSCDVIDSLEKPIIALYVKPGKFIVGRSGWRALYVPRKITRKFTPAVAADTVRLILLDPAEAAIKFDLGGAGGGIVACAKDLKDYFAAASNPALDHGDALYPSVSGFCADFIAVAEKGRVRAG